MWSRIAPLILLGIVTFYSGPFIEAAVWPPAGPLVIERIEKNGDSSQIFGKIYKSRPCYPEEVSAYAYDPLDSDVPKTRIMLLTPNRTPDWASRPLGWSKVKGWRLERQAGEDLGPMVDFIVRHDCGGWWKITSTFHRMETRAIFGAGE